MIVVDTSILVDHLRGVTDARDAMRTAVKGKDTLTVSVLTKVELLAGMRTRERASVRQLLERMTWAGVTDEIAEEAGALARRYRRSHPGVGVVDFVIAATTRSLDANLWTRNVRHFPMITGLRPPY